MPPVKRVYAKPALTPADLLAHLVARGLVVPHPIDALHALEYVGYYRLLIYMRPLQVEDPAGVRRFVAGTTFEDVFALYNFDRELRLLCLDAVERIEVALRAAIVSQVAVPAGAPLLPGPPPSSTASTVSSTSTRRHAARSGI
jgi:abortive infection bacteriophage resistance protein